MNYSPARYVSQKPRRPVSRRLGDLLVAAGLLTPAQLQKALGEQKGSTEKRTNTMKVKIIGYDGNEHKVVGELRLRGDKIVKRSILSFQCGTRANCSSQSLPSRSTSSVE